MAYLYTSNLDPLNRSDQLEIMLDNGDSAILKRGSYYDLSAGELARARQYVVMTFVNTTAIVEPTGVRYLPVKGNPANGQVPVFDAGQGAFTPAAVSGVGVVASAVPFSPTGTVSATNVQAAIAEVAAESSGGGGGTASSVAFTPTGTVASTNVQSAIAEVSGDVTTTNSSVTAANASIAAVAADVDAVIADVDVLEGAISQQSSIAFSPTLRSPQSVDRAIHQLPQLLAYWRFNERSGTVIYDDFRTHDATLTPGTEKLGTGGLGFSDGRTGMSVTADGTIIQVADQGSNDTLRLVNKPYSLGWIGRLIALPASSYVWVVSKRNNGPTLLVTSTGAITLSWFDGAAKDITTSGGLLNPGSLYMIGATFDGSTARIFLNGREVASSAETDAGIISTGPLTILASTTGTGNLKAQTAALFVTGEAVAEPAWDDLWAKAVAKPLYPLGDPVKTYRIAIDAAADLTNPVGDADRYDVIVVQAWRTAYRDAVKNANPNCRMLCYQEIAAMGVSRDAGTGLSSTLVNYDEAGNAPPSAANAAAGPNSEWFLTSIATGLPFTFASYSFLWAADIGDLAYQARAVKNVRALLEGSRWDGVFLDDANPSLVHHHTVTDVAEYPSDLTYNLAMQGFLRRLISSIEGVGKIALPNYPAHEFYLQSDFEVELAGGLDEYALSYPPNTFQTAGTIDRVLRYGMETQRRGHHFLIGIAANMTGETPEASKARFGLATALLITEGRAFTGITGSYSPRIWSTEWEGHGYLGAPVERAVRLSNGLWRRRYDGGIVYLNPTTSGIAETFPGTYTGSGLTNSTGATLAAQSGYVMRQV